MDNKTNILSMLGLALRGNRLAVGEEPVEAVARARDARVLLLASDAADNTKRRCRHFAEAGQCLWLTIPFTQDELGQATGRSSVAIVALTDVGMAASFVHKLAALDPQKYSEAAERLDIKAKRAAERKAEMHAHEKNVRQGKCKKKEPAVKEEAVEETAPVQEKTWERKPYPPRRTGFGGPRKDGWKPRDNHGPRKDGWKPRDDQFRGNGEKRPSNGERRTYGGKPTGKSRPSKQNRPKSRSAYNPYAHSLPVKKGKGSFRKRED